MGADTNDPSFKERVRAVLRDCCLRGDDENAVRIIRDWKLFDDLADMPPGNCAISLISNIIDMTPLEPQALDAIQPAPPDSDGLFAEIASRPLGGPVRLNGRPITGVRFRLSDCVVMKEPGQGGQFAIRQLEDGVVEVVIHGMVITSALDQDLAVLLATERSHHAATLAELADCRAQLLQLEGVVAEYQARIAKLEQSTE